MSIKPIILRDVNHSPALLPVRTKQSINFSFRLPIALPSYSSIVIRLRGGRNNKNDWYYLQGSDPQKAGYLKLSTQSDPKILPVLTTGKELSLEYLILNSEGIKKNELLRFHLSNTLTQSIVEKQKPIEVLIKIRDKTYYASNPPRFDITHGTLDQFHIIVPSIVKKGKSIRILIRAEDEYKNLVIGFDDTIRLIGKKENNETFYEYQIPFDINDHGLKYSENIIINEEGNYTFLVQYEDLVNKSNICECSNHISQQNLYWGYIHGHTSKSDGVRGIEEYFQNLHNAGLDFGTSTEHDRLWETNDEDFAEIKRITVKQTMDGDFISLFGYEWGTWYSGYGDICIYHFNDEIPIFRSEVNKYNSVEKLTQNLLPYKERVLMIAHHTALRPGYRSWDEFNNSLERLVEIYSTWGNQEYSSLEGNPLPPRYKFFGYGQFARKRGPILEKKGSFVLDALMKGYKLGFTAGGDDHFGIFPSGSIDPDNGIYPPGIMAVWADNLSKSAIWEALYTRRCYGSTGVRVIIRFAINEYVMGEIINLTQSQALAQQREIKIDIKSPLPINRIELIRNGSILKELYPEVQMFSTSITDNTAYNEIKRKHSTEPESFVFYYLRIFLAENNMAWSSPIWIIQKEEQL